METRSTPIRTPIRRQRAQQKQQYLIGYNLLCTVLWTAVLGRVLLLIPMVGLKHVYGGVGDFAKWTQTLAMMEIVHSASGLVRSPLLTTAMQVSSRLLLVWPVLTPQPFAPVTQSSGFYSTMLLAWSITEIIRYGYFVFNLQNLKSGVPAWLVWLRYNTFYVLYPLGIASECSLILKASVAQVGTQDGIWSQVQWSYWGILAVYVPGSYVLFTHMMTQRKKVLKGKQVEAR